MMNTSNPTHIKYNDTEIINNNVNRKPLSLENFIEYFNIETLPYIKIKEYYNLYTSALIKVDTEIISLYQRNSNIAINTLLEYIQSPKQLFDETIITNIDKQSFKCTIRDLVLETRLLNDIITNVL